MLSPNGLTPNTVSVVKQSVALNFITQLHIIFCSSVLRCSAFSPKPDKENLWQKKVFNYHQPKGYQHKDVFIDGTAKQTNLISSIVVLVHEEVWGQWFPLLSNKLTLHWSLSLCLHRDNTRWSCWQKIPGHISSATASFWRTERSFGSRDNTTNYINSY